MDDFPRTFARRVGFAALAALLWAGTACLDGEPVQGRDDAAVDAGADVGARTCATRRDCREGEECVDGVCKAPQVECTSNSDCPGDQACVLRQCISQPGDAGTCSSGCQLSTDAGPGQCVPGNADEACGKGGEACTICKENETCEQGECVEQNCNELTCPDGCCKEGECKPGDSRDACGTGGSACSSCEGEQQCKEGQCVSGCDSENCNGCCDGGECITEMTDEQCGANGAACQSCGEGKTCANGQCIEASCNMSCDGCCDQDGNCQTGDAETQCGSGGDSCWDCPNGWTCESRNCAVKPNGRWDVIAVSAEVPERNASGVFWDNRFNKPDPFLKVKVDGPTQTKKAKTSVVDGDLTPTWRETTVEDIRAEALRGSDNVTLELVDNDPIFNDQIAKCTKSFVQDDFTGSNVRFICKGTQSGSNPVETTINLRLRYHP